MTIDVAYILLKKNCYQGTRKPEEFPQVGCMRKENIRVSVTIDSDLFNRQTVRTICQSRSTLKLM